MCEPEYRPIPVDGDHPIDPVDKIDEADSEVCETWLEAAHSILPIDVEEEDA